MTPELRTFNTRAVTALLGVVFRDTATGDRVGSGLVVEARPKSAPARPAGRRARAVANPSGVYVLHDAPGLGALRFGAGDEEFWSNLPAPADYVLEVEDSERRFLPFRFEAGLPLRGLFNWASPLGQSPPESPASVPLYSSPTRKVPQGMAALRAGLWDAEADAPAAWAVVEAYWEDELIARGMSDEEGRLALLFPYPAPVWFAVASPVDSPPVARGLPLTEQSWELTLRAGYERAAELAGATFPDLRRALEQLNAPPARLWADGAGTELTTVTLEFGRELVVRTEGAASLSPPAPQSALLITPAASPP